MRLLTSSTAGVVLLAGTLLSGAWMLQAQDTPKEEKPREEVERPRKKEEEAKGPVRPRRNVPVPVDDGPTLPAPARATAAAASDLLVAAKQTQHRVLRDLYFDLGKPHDVVNIGERVERVRPLPGIYEDNKVAYRGPIVPYNRNDDWKEGPAYTITRGHSVHSIEPYEIVAMARVKQFLDSGLDRLAPSAERYLSRPEMLSAAENVLAFVLRFHESARQIRQREGAEWDKVETALRERLLDAQLQQMNAYADAKDWDGAYRLATRLKEAYADPGIQGRIADPLSRLVTAAIKDEQYPQAQLRLRLLENLFPANKVARPISDDLRHKAELHLKEARDEGRPDQLKPEQRQRVLRLLELAEREWSQLPGLQDYRLKVMEAYPVLHVGVRHLPGTANLSPATAVTDSERWAVELMFESLVRLIDHGGAGQHYEPGLAAALPEVVPLGRRFQLPPNAFWANGQAVTAGDISHTVQMLRDRGAGRVLAWADLIGDVHAGADAFRVNVSFRQGYFDPLSLLTFKVLPQGRARDPADPTFAGAPLGSGPFMYAGHIKEPVGATSRQYVKFVANPHYGSRNGKRGLPRIREIHLIASPSPVEDLAEKKLHLYLDLPLGGEIKGLRSGAPAVRIAGPLPTRRVYFLAVNHRQTALADANLRLALAYAINREAVLDARFRPVKEDKAHRALNGPYPADSWACAEPSKVPAVLYDVNRARSFLSLVTKGQPPPKLSLKYPGGDPQLEAALTDLVNQVKQDIGLELVPEKRSPHELHREVEVAHDYELAYYHYDYPSDAYWLWPLFDPRATGPGGSNYLGYEPGADVQAEFQRALSHRHFQEVRTHTRLVHELLHKKEMPLIPLWQLDRYFAYHADLLFDPDHATGLKESQAPLDPLLVFPDVERWQLQPTAVSRK